MNTLHDLRDPIRAKLEQGEVSLGSFLLSANTTVAESMAHHAIDWMVIDMEASHASKEDLVHLLQALNAYDVTAIVRVPYQNKHWIESSLDFGARGVMVPKVDTAAQAEAVAMNCRYPPRGNRGVNCIRASAYYTRAGEYLVRANDAVLSIVQIESPEAVENAAAIAAMPDIQVLFMGLGDLAACYGQNGVITGARMDSARARVVEACRRHHKAAGVFAPTVAYANQYIREGFQFVAIGNDIKYLNMGLAQCLSGIEK